MTEHDTARGEDLRLFLEIADTLNRGDDFEAGLERVLARVSHALDADATGLCVRDASNPGGEMRVAFERPGGGLETAQIDVENGLRRRVIATGEPIRSDDVRDDPLYEPAIDRPFGIEPRALLAVPLRLRDEVIGVLYAIRTSKRSFAAHDEALLSAIADKLAVWVQNDALLRELRAELAERKLLLKVSRTVGQSIELEQVLELVFDALHQEVPFDAAAIFLTGEDGKTLDLAAQRGYSSPDLIRVVPIEQGIIGRVQRLLHGALIDDVRDHSDYYEARSSTRSEMAVPIVSGGRGIGVINLESDIPHAYDERSLRIAEMIAGQVSFAIANARLHASRLERSQVEHELGLAREIQLSLLPATELDDDALTIVAVNVPSSAVGGDYYDYVMLPDGHAFVVLADVSGHGLSAALLTASMRTGFRLLARQTHDPAEIARRLSEVLYEGSPDNQFVAAVIGELDLATGELRYCNAGHVPPLAIAPDGTTRSLWGGGVPLGLFPGATYQTETVRLNPGELLAFYTDGIPEAEDEEGDQLGVAAVDGALVENRERPLAHIRDTLRRMVREHRGRRGGHIDDITLLLTRWNGPAAATLRAERGDR